MTIAVRRLTGEEIANHLSDLARLRMEVFADFPYLYDGDAEYEALYVKEFAAEEGSVLVAAFDGASVIGAATASPMSGQKREFRKPFEERGIDTSKLFYFGESVLLPQFRGQGIGHAFFDHREAAARDAAAEATCFAAVVRSVDHPARPTGYRSLDDFWSRRGYKLIPGLTTSLDWKEHGEGEESSKQMQYYMRRL